MDVQQLTFELQDNEMKVPVLHKEPHPLEKAVCDTACDFRELFQSLDLKKYIIIIPWPYAETA